MQEEILYKINYETTRMSSVNIATNYIRNNIILQKYNEDTSLTEIGLAEEWGLSRGSIRSALQILENEGLIRTLENGRKQVIPFTLKSVADLYAVRSMLEVSALQQILEHMNRNDFSETHLMFWGMASKMKSDNGELVSNETRVRIDAEFHRAIITASGNNALLQCWNSIEPVIWAMLSINATISVKDMHMKQFERHNELVGRIIRNDPNVISELQQHIEISHQMVEEALIGLNCK